MEPGDRETDEDGMILQVQQTDKGRNKEISPNERGLRRPRGQRNIPSHPTQPMHKAGESETKKEGFCTCFCNGIDPSRDAWN